MANVAEQPAFPETWRWEPGKQGEPADGETVDGSFVRFDKGATRDFGSKLILVLEVDGRERSLWLLETALVNKVRDELSDRPGHSFQPGERLVITRQPKKQTEDGKRSYHPFKVYCPERPEVDAASFLGIGADSSKREQRPAFESDGQDDDIPF